MSTPIRLHFHSTGDAKQDQEKLAELATHAGMKLFHRLDITEQLELARAACVYYIAAKLACDVMEDSTAFRAQRAIMQQLFTAAEIDLTLATTISPRN